MKRRHAHHMSTIEHALRSLHPHTPPHTPTPTQKQEDHYKRSEALFVAAFLPVLEVGLEEPLQTCLALRPFFFLPFHRHPRKEVEEEEKEEEQEHAGHDLYRLG